jgi:6-pyruvoyltetrahydropterin/6-carboxytetrahydropterin synthase
MKAEIIKTFRFEAAHALPNVPPEHKCSRLHGHSYRVDIHLAGEVDPRLGWVMDYGDLKALVGPILDELDHRDLGKVPGLDNSTSENLGKYLWDRIKPKLAGLTRIVVWESENNRCVYRGE